MATMHSGRIDRHCNIYYYYVDPADYGRDRETLLVATRVLHKGSLVPISIRPCAVFACTAFTAKVTGVGFVRIQNFDF